MDSIIFQHYDLFLNGFFNSMINMFNILGYIDVFTPKFFLNVFILLYAYMTVYIILKNALTHVKTSGSSSSQSGLADQIKDLYYKSPGNNFITRYFIIYLIVIFLMFPIPFFQMSPIVEKNSNNNYYVKHWIINDERVEQHTNITFDTAGTMLFGSNGNRIPVTHVPFIVGAPLALFEKFYYGWSWDLNDYKITKQKMDNYTGKTDILMTTFNIFPKEYLKTNSSLVYSNCFNIDTNTLKPNSVCNKTTSASTLKTSFFKEFEEPAGGILNNLFKPLLNIIELTKSNDPFKSMTRLFQNEIIVESSIDNFLPKIKATNGSVKGDYDRIRTELKKEIEKRNIANIQEIEKIKYSLVSLLEAETPYGKVMNIPYLKEYISIYLENLNETTNISTIVKVNGYVDIDAKINTCVKENVNCISSSYSKISQIIKEDDTNEYDIYVDENSVNNIYFSRTTANPKVITNIKTISSLRTKIKNLFNDIYVDGKMKSDTVYVLGNSENQIVNKKTNEGIIKLSDNKYKEYKKINDLLNEANIVFYKNKMLSKYIYKKQREIVSLYNRIFGISFLIDTPKKLTFFLKGGENENGPLKWTKEKEKNLYYNLANYKYLNYKLIKLSDKVTILMRDVSSVIVSANPNERNDYKSNIEDLNTNYTLTRSTYSIYQSLLEKLVKSTNITEKEELKMINEYEYNIFNSELNENEFQPIPIKYNVSIIKTAKQGNIQTKEEAILTDISNPTKIDEKYKEKYSDKINELEPVLNNVNIGEAIKNYKLVDSLLRNKIKEKNERASTAYYLNLIKLSLKPYIKKNASGEWKLSEKLTSLIKSSITQEMRDNYIVVIKQTYRNVHKKTSNAILTKLYDKMKVYFQNIEKLDTLSLDEQIKSIFMVYVATNSTKPIGTNNLLNTVIDQSDNITDQMGNYTISDRLNSKIDANVVSTNGNINTGWVLSSAMYFIEKISDYINSKTNVLRSKVVTINQNQEGIVDPNVVLGKQLYLNQNVLSQDVDDIVEENMEIETSDNFSLQTVVEWILAILFVLISIAIISLIYWSLIMQVIGYLYLMLIAPFGYIFEKIINEAKNSTMQKVPFAGFFENSLDKTLKMNLVWMYMLTAFIMLDYVYSLLYKYLFETQNEKIFIKDFIAAITGEDNTLSMLDSVLSNSLIPSLLYGGMVILVIYWIRDHQSKIVKEEISNLGKQINDIANEFNELKNSNATLNNKLN